MIFNNANEDLIEYYFLNREPFTLPKNSGFSCSSFSYLYILYGRALNWFMVSYSSGSSHFLKNNIFFESRFSERAGSSIFGIHNIEYLRRVYNKRSNTFVLHEVRHPDTIYDLPYFYKMDNATKAKKE